MTPEPPARIWPYLLVNLFVAGWLDFSRIHQMMNPDSVIYSLASLYEWRPFFWEQDRVGLLWPLLFSWSRDPLLTLLLQTFTTTYLGLCMPVLFARVISPHRAGPALATAAGAVVILCVTHDDRGQSVILDNWLVVCNFPGSLTLALGAILILERDGGGRWVRAGRVLLAGGLLLAAHWVYLGVLLFLVPFVLYRGWQPGPTPAVSWRRVLVRPLLQPAVRWFLIGSVVSAAAVFALMQYVLATDPSVGPTPTRELPVERWPWVWGSLVGMLFLEPGIPLAAGAFAVVAGAGLVWGLTFDRLAVKALALRTLPVFLAALGEFAFLGTRFWVENNSYHPRYLVAAGTGLSLSVLLVGLAPVVGRWRWAGVFAVGLLGVACVVRFGWPGPDVPRQSVEWAAWNTADDLAGLDIDGVGGDYPTAWSVVFAANVRRHELGLPELWGVSYRAGPLRHRWADPDRTYRVAVVRVDQDWERRHADLYAGLYGLRRVSPEPVATRGRVEVYEYRAVAP
jgi:hypothetical protein